MKKILHFSLAILLFVFSHFLAFSQTQSPIDKAIPWAQTDTKPSFNGGDINQFLKWIYENIQFPANADKSANDRISVLFVIDENGEVCYADSKSGNNEAFKEEAVRVVKSSPKWEAGKLNGKDVSVAYTISIVFNYSVFEQAKNALTQLRSVSPSSIAGCWYGNYFGLIIFDNGTWYYSYSGSEGIYGIYTIQGDMITFKTTNNPSGLAEFDKTLQINLKENKIGNYERVDFLKEEEEGVEFPYMTKARYNNWKNDVLKKVSSNFNSTPKENSVSPSSIAGCWYGNYFGLIVFDNGTWYYSYSGSEGIYGIYTIQGDMITFKTTNNPSDLAEFDKTLQINLKENKIGNYERVDFLKEEEEGVEFPYMTKARYNNWKNDVLKRVK